MIGTSAKLSVSLSLLRAMWWRRERLWDEIRRAARPRLEGNGTHDPDAGRNIETDATSGEAPRTRRA